MQVSKLREEKNIPVEGIEEMKKEEFCEPRRKNGCRFVVCLFVGNEIFGGY
jgi:hypothetical protein